MTEVLRNDGSESTVYRSRGVVMFDEDAQPWGRRKRTRVSARYDRTHWEPEYYHRPFIEVRSPHAPNHESKTPPFNTQTFSKGGAAASATFLAAMRKTQASRTKPTKASKLALTDRRLAEAPGHQRRYTKAELEAVPMHGKYRLGEVLEYGEHGGMKVRAICEGGFCPGKVRMFGPGEWLNLTMTMSCPRCDARQKRADLHAQMKRDVNPFHGKYRFLRFEDRGDEDCNFTRRVIGECTGNGDCGGRTRGFLFNAWQQSTEGLTGCYQCTQVGRRKRGATTPTTKLDAAASEMRQLEEAV